ncbi:MAG: hypothetical protein LUG21_00095 [Clostridiales bacterium]|nr:hypothetical protein [Clostridiales bacterium]
MKESYRIGKIDSIYELGLLYSIDKPEKAFKCFENAAYKDHGKSMIKLAYCYINGTGTNINMENASKWCMRAKMQNEDCSDLESIIYESNK